ncbi:CubicO group peptidase (beta-lactamase class C family) [Asanoa ferruginea]|uniref:CubicO group peptidase (Beta-lactamase class C family) n=1 Tax=Asanoa ferruginea TaxID=53367 RepID=A0A3D9ZXS2_9ACTN|nr:serine hydrolase domain-containing protein [Asanoa ferruginea]REG01373.1 CubicO group peptidase (beta-lactamase class C family) [Asanoa ferruginea]GIF48002.1 esterase [Asanoa ferruginea]
MSDIERQVAEVVERLVDDGAERGVQVAVYRHGEQIVDVAAGEADAGRPVTADTLFHVTSTGKGVTSTVLHTLVSDDVLTYDLPIVDVWPEFGVNGKDRATLRDALTHSVGVPAVPVDTTPEDLCDWDRMCALIAGATPWWEPGTRTGYHPHTFGFILGEIVRRATGKTISTVLRERVAEPLGVGRELFFGVPQDDLDRVARHEDAAGMTITPDMAASMAETVPFFRVLDGWTAAPLGAMPDAAYCNRRDVLTADIPAGGVMSARAIARMYAALLGPVDGVRLLSPSRLREVTTVAASGTDAVIGFPARRGLGFDLGFQGALGSATLFGMAGSSGTAAYADPATGVVVAVAKNRVTAGDYATFGAVSAVVAANL